MPNRVSDQVVLKIPKIPTKVESFASLDNWVAERLERVVDQIPFGKEGIGVDKVVVLRYIVMLMQGQEWTWMTLRN